MDSDSDPDDDHVLLTATFSKRPSRLDAQKQRKNETFLDELVEESEREIHSLVRMTQIKREHGVGNEQEDADFMHRTVQLTQEYKETSAGVSELRRKQDNEDIVAGIMDDDGVLSREQRIARKRGMDMDLSSAWGLRSVVAFDATRASGIEVFQTNQDVVDSLRQRIRSDDAHDLLLRSMYEAACRQLLPEFLQLPRFTEHLESDASDCSWLGGWIYSAMFVQGLGNEALKALILLRTLNKLDDSWTLEKLWKSLSLFLNIAAKPKFQRKQVSPDPVKNIQGLKNCLALWGAIVPKLDASSLCEVAAADCVVALIRLGIDDDAAVNQHKEANLSPLLRCVLTALVDKVARKYADSPAVLEQWMQKTAAAALEGLGELGPGAEGSDDADDTEAWLCRVAAVQVVALLPACPRGGTALKRFAAQLALFAAQDLLPGTDGIDVRVARVLNERGNGPLAKLASTSLPWLAMAAAYVGLIELDMQGNKVLDDPCLYVATVQCLLIAYECGLNLLEDACPGSEGGSGGEYGSTQQAKELAAFWVPFDKLCAQLSKLSSNLSTNRYFRRADYTLMCVRHYIFQMKRNVSRQAGVEADGSPEKKQAKLSSFFTAKGPEAASPLEG